MQCTFLPIVICLVRSVNWLITFLWTLTPKISSLKHTRPVHLITYAQRIDFRLRFFKRECVVPTFFLGWCVQMVLIKALQSFYSLKWQHEVKVRKKIIATAKLDRSQTSEIVERVWNKNRGLFMRARRFFGKAQAEASLEITFKCTTLFQSVFFFFWEPIKTYFVTNLESPIRETVALMLWKLCLEV